MHMRKHPNCSRHITQGYTTTTICLQIHISVQEVQACYRLVERAAFNLEALLVLGVYLASSFPYPTYTIILHNVAVWGIL